MNKKLILYHSILIALLFISIPLKAFGVEKRRYISSFPPSDSMIINKSSELRRCTEGISKIVGKLQISKNTWTVYYEAFSAKTNNFEVYDNMHLKKLDTGVWVLECGKHITGRSYDTFFDQID